MSALTQVWDGITPWRKKPVWDAPPQGRDLDEIIAEIRKTQSAVLGGTNEAAFNLTKFGGDPSGIIDSTQALRDAQISAGIFGGYIYAPKGNYLISSSVDIYCNIKGDGKNSTKFQCNSAFIVFDINERNDLTLEDFTIEPVSGSFSSAASCGIRVRGNCNNISLNKITCRRLGFPVRLAGNEGTNPKNPQYTVRFGGQAVGTWQMVWAPLTGGNLLITSAMVHNISAADLQTELGNLGIGSVTVTGAYPTFQITLNTGQASLQPRIIPNVTGLADFSVTLEEDSRGGSWITSPILFQFTAAESPSNWGAEFNYTEGLVVDDSWFINNGLDGLKGRQFCWNSRISNTYSCRNGRSNFSQTNPAQGDGADWYAGGEYTSFVNCTFNENFGTGLLFKNDDLNGALTGYTAGKFGAACKADIVNLTACRNQVIGGAWFTYITRAGVDPLLSVAVSSITMTGGMLMDNAKYNLVIYARNFTAFGTKLRRGALNNIFIGDYADGVQLWGVTCLHPIGPAASNVLIRGKNVQIRGGFFDSWDTDLLLQGTDRTQGTKTALANIYIDSQAVNVYVDMPDAPEGTTTGLSIQGSNTATNAIIRQTGNLTPGVDAIYGHPGSEYFKKDTGVLYRKLSSGPTSTGGWQVATVNLATQNVWSAGALFGQTPGALTARLSGGLWQPTTVSGSNAFAEQQVIANPGANHAGSIYGTYVQLGSALGNTRNFNIMSSFGAQVTHRGTGTITDARALTVQSPGIPNGGLITTNQGLVIENQTITGVTTGVAIDQQGTSDLIKLKGPIGFFGSAPIAKPAVTGSRAGNAALASALTALSSYGLITDSTTA